MVDLILVNLETQISCRSGWGKYYNNDPVKFLGTDKNDESTLKFPG